ncbi:MAG: hypothetical protein KAW19_00340 [Candidatus Aminicenantes bacterium]|nr:hypothetical protein [Candidatus Aminicenantes bacterium]
MAKREKVLQEGFQPKKEIQKGYQPQNVQDSSRYKPPESGTAAETPKNEGKRK